MQIVRALDEQFARLHERSHALVRAVAPERLYWQPPRESAGLLPAYSCGEHLLRSAAAVEQTFGGINVNLWDDPFEWTLPEALPTPAHVAAYLDEAEATRLRAFAQFRSDRDLTKEIATPSGRMRTLFALAAETLARAAHHQGRALATFRLFSDARLPAA
ncbi:MAG TPA: hypothetical protein VN228_11310 [Pyrinomonadaceae bacterium]|nr:hypothetical protein [Pyrinomonadaceae bacterium]